MEQKNTLYQIKMKIVHIQAKEVKVWLKPRKGSTDYSVYNRKDDLQEKGWEP